MTASFRKILLIGPQLTATGIKFHFNLPLQTTLLKSTATLLHLCAISGATFPQPNCAFGPLLVFDIIGTTLVGICIMIRDFTNMGRHVNCIQRFSSTHIVVAKILFPGPNVHPG